MTNQYISFPNTKCCPMEHPDATSVALKDAYRQWLLDMHNILMFCCEHKWINWYDTANAVGRNTIDFEPGTDFYQLIIADAITGLWNLLRHVKLSHWCTHNVRSQKYSNEFPQVPDTINNITWKFQIEVNRLMLNRGD